MRSIAKFDAFFVVVNTSENFFFYKIKRERDHFDWKRPRTDEDDGRRPRANKKKLEVVHENQKGRPQEKWDRRTKGMKK